MPQNVFDDATRKARLDEAAKRRKTATGQSTAQLGSGQASNDDEVFPYLFNFTKGLPHSIQGIVENPGASGDDLFNGGGGDYGLFVRGTRDPNPTAFDAAPLSAADPRKWESPTGGFAFTLQGPDAQSIPIPPAPAAASNELSAEMAEVYQMALLRDCPVAAFMEEDKVHALGNKYASASFGTVEAAAATLSTCKWFCGEENSADANSLGRRRLGETQTPSNLFRGIGEGTGVGPLVSQFMVMGTGDAVTSRDGLEVRYGNQRIPQDTRVAIPGKDYMQSWGDWLDVQRACDVRDQTNEFVQTKDGLAYRPILTLRDIATYVHDDALYQAYLNAALLLLSEGASVDRGIPYTGSTLDGANPNRGENRSPFSVFGAPHLLTLVTEVSALALRAVRFQKFTAHRRARPEGVAARYHTVLSKYDPSGSKPFADSGAEAEAHQVLESLLAPQLAGGANSDPGLTKTLDAISTHNAKYDHSWLRAIVKSGVQALLMRRLDPGLMS